MTKYQCDIYGCKNRCPNQAVIAYDSGSELHFFCHMHIHAFGSKYLNAYWINGDAMEENAQNCPETNEVPVTAETLRDTAKRLIAARDERLKDRLIMHALGVRWS